jgi:hypothetical protein
VDVPCSTCEPCVLLVYPVVVFWWRLHDCICGAGFVLNCPKLLGRSIRMYNIPVPVKLVLDVAVAINWVRSHEVWAGECMNCQGGLETVRMHCMQLAGVLTAPLPEVPLQLVRASCGHHLAV